MERTAKRLAVACLAMVFLCHGICAHAQPLKLQAKDGEYAVDVAMTGGSGKAAIVSPTALYVRDGCAYAQLVWSSENYDYMVVDGEKLFNENEGGYSTFTVPVTVFDEEMEVIADTTAMGVPHEITYRLTFYADSIASKSTLPQEAAKRVLAAAFAIIAVGGILNYFVNKRRDRDFEGKRREPSKR